MIEIIYMTISGTIAWNIAFRIVMIKDWLQLKIPHHSESRLYFTMNFKKMSLSIDLNLLVFEDAVDKPKKHT